VQASVYAGSAAEIQGLGKSTPIYVHNHRQSKDMAERGRVVYIAQDCAVREI
jgi:hypothetical protein